MPSISSKGSVPREDGKHRYVSAHRVVWEFYYGTSDLNLTINHKNGNTLDNRPENLELVSNRVNAVHGHSVLGRGNGSRNKGEQNPQCKLNVEKVSDIKRRLGEGESGNSLAALFAVSPMTISNIKHGVIWKDVK